MLFRSTWNAATGTADLDTASARPPQANYNSEDLYWLSREIRRQTGKTYTRLVQEKRLAQATFLLRNTDRNVDDIANAVGYENLGYFHRIFRDSYGCSPREYRMQIR